MACNLGFAGDVYLWEYTSTLVLNMFTTIVKAEIIRDNQTVLITTWTA